MSKKVVQTIVLLLLLVVFPSVSWLFLKDGVRYRMDARANLNAKALVPQNSPLYERGKLKVLYNTSNPVFQGRIKPIAEHFGDRTEILSFVDLDETKLWRDSLDQVIELSGHTNRDYEKYAYLIDTTASLVQGYFLEDDKDMAALAQDIAFLLPLEKDKDFLIKREREK
jgi:hypothetical protein